MKNEQNIVSLLVYLSGLLPIQTNQELGEPNCNHLYQSKIQRPLFVSCFNTKFSEHNTVLSSNPWLSEPVPS